MTFSVPLPLPFSGLGGCRQHALCVQPAPCPGWSLSCGDGVTWRIKGLNKYAGQRDGFAISQQK